MNNTPPRISRAPNKIISMLVPRLYPTSRHRAGRFRRFTRSTNRSSTLVHVPDNGPVKSYQLGLVQLALIQGPQGHLEKNSR
jgi:hypothetical protein